MAQFSGEKKTQEQIVSAYWASSKKGSGHTGFHSHILMAVHAARMPPASSSLEIKMWVEL